MKKGAIIIWVDYEEFKPETYKGVWATEEENLTTCRSFTGDYEEDFAFVSKYAKLTGKDIIYSSSVYDYAMNR